jgi:hypothetical protein
MVLNILDVAIGLESRNMGLGVFESKHTAVSQETLFYVGLVHKVVYTVLSRVDKEALAFVELGHQMGASAGRTRSSADNIEVLRRRKISSSLVVNRTQEFKIGNGADYDTNESWRRGFCLGPASASPVQVYALVPVPIIPPISDFSDIVFKWVILRVLQKSPGSHTLAL